MTPRRLAWVAMGIGASVAGVLHGFDASHWAALLLGACVAAVIGFGVSVAAGLFHQKP